MSRHLYVKNGLVTNIVEHSVQPPDVSDQGEDIVPDLTSTLSIGSVYDVTPDTRERTYNKLDTDTFLRVMMREIFRINNAVRVLQGGAQETAAQFKARIKAGM